MSNKIDMHVAQAFAEIAIFFEFSGEDVIDPDVASQFMEQLSATLQLADVETRRDLCNRFEEVALAYSSEKKSFLRDLGESLGLTDV